VGDAKKENKMRTSKTQQVKTRLIQFGAITSWQAIQLFGATRLSAIIFNLRDRGMDIKSKAIEGIDKNGYKTRYVEYTYKEVGK
jgi:hypothetical protein